MGVVLLKPLNEALDSGDYIYGVIRGTGAKHKGKGAGYLLPSPKKQADLINAVLSQCNLSAEDIDYIEGQTMGSEMTDVAEWEALRQVFKSGESQKKSYLLGSLKPNIGHLEAASGIAQLSKVLMQFKYNEVAGTMLAQQMRKDIDYSQSCIKLLDKSTPWASRADNSSEENADRKGCALINSWGAGGVQACIIVEEYNNSEAGHDQHSNQKVSNAEDYSLITLSAQSDEQLKEYSRRLRTYLKTVTLMSKSDGVLLLQRIAYTLQTGRRAMPYRLGIVVRELSELIDCLESFEREVKDSVSIFYGKWDVSKKQKEQPLWEGEERLGFKYWACIAQRWVDGAPVAWQAFYVGKKIVRLPLPTYPFAQRRCWINSGITTQQQDQKLLPLKDKAMSEPIEKMSPNTNDSNKLKDKVVSHYYDQAASLTTLEQLEKTESHLIFAPLVNKPQNFSWLLTMMQPEQYHEHFVLSLAKQKSLKTFACIR